MLSLPKSLSIFSSLFFPFPFSSTRLPRQPPEISILFFSPQIAIPPKVNPPSNFGCRPLESKISSNSWHTDPRRMAGGANMNTKPPHSCRALESAIKSPLVALAPPLQSEWQWAARMGTANTSQSRDPTCAQGSTGQDFGSNADYNQLDDESDDDELGHWHFRSFC